MDDRHQEVGILGRYPNGAVMLGMIGTYIFMALLTCFTLGIALPWAICIWQNWVAKHTIIDGKQMVFDGTCGVLQL